MTIEQEIVAWSATRPAWQRAVLRRLARGEELSDDECVQLSKHLASGGIPDESPLTLADLPGGQPASDDPVRLLGVQKLVHVNALAPNQSLELAPIGLTVVYGDNASGKSGYARLLKAVVHAPRGRKSSRTSSTTGHRRDQPRRSSWNATASRP